MTVRVVHHGNSKRLLAVFADNVGALSEDKRRALLWPSVTPAGQETTAARDAGPHFQRDRDHVEDGVPLHRHRFKGAVGRAVLAILQGRVLINILRS